jgi:hypothetical protein
MISTSVNPLYAAQARKPKHRPVYAKLPQAPVNASSVPHLTSLYHWDEPGPYGDRRYPGNCSGGLIRDLLRYSGVTNVLDPMPAAERASTCARSCSFHTIRATFAKGRTHATQTSFRGSSLISLGYIRPTGDRSVHRQFPRPVTDADAGRLPGRIH